MLGPEHHLAIVVQFDAFCLAFELRHPLLLDQSRPAERCSRSLIDARKFSSRSRKHLLKWSHHARLGDITVLGVAFQNWMPFAVVLFVISLSALKEKL
jgi:hypothetical protein